MKSISMPLMSNEALNDLKSSRPFVKEEQLNPVNWRTNI